MSIDNEGIVILRVSSADINEDVKSTTIDVNSRERTFLLGNKNTLEGELLEYKAQSLRSGGKVIFEMM